MLEMEGVNTYGIWDYSDWNTLAEQLKKGYDYGKQRCTAYVRFVVERRLFPQFLETYWDAMRDLKVGNPTLVDQRRRQAARPGVRPRHQRPPGPGPGPPLPERAANRRHAHSTRASSTTACSCPARTAAPTAPRAPW